MSSDDTKTHWETIYQTKGPQEVSWTQDVPQTSLDFVRSVQLAKSAGILDVGGGDSKLVDFLLDDGYSDITVLDISAAALDRAKKRLGAKADLVRWIVSDIIEYQPDRKFTLWHDRAVFHFLTTEQQIAEYIDRAHTAIEPGGYLAIATFSMAGPRKCSGLNTRQYSGETLTQQLGAGFEKIRCSTEDHITPTGGRQNFLYCLFRRRREQN